MKDVKHLIEEKMSTISANTWTKCIGKVMEVEAEYWRSDNIAINDIEKVKCNSSVNC